VFDLPEIVIGKWRESDFTPIRQSIRKVEKLKKKAGTDSKAFQDSCRRLLDALFKSGSEEVNSRLVKKVDVRALTYLMANSSDFIEQYEFNNNSISHILHVRNRLGMLNLTQLIRAYFMHFDTLARNAEIGVLSRFVDDQLRKATDLSPDNFLAKQKLHRAKLFDIKGPQHVTSAAINNSEDLDVTFVRFGLNGYSNGRFQKICRYRYYIEQLKNLELDVDHELLHEVANEHVYMSPAGDGKLLGHLILEVIIDRVPDEEISEPWQQVILSIASDPRVSTTSSEYQQWWMPLGKERVEKVTSWLSRFDLKLFLEVLKVTAHQSGDRSKIEMFKTRKKFMEGLLELKLIKKSRLFLGHMAAINLKRAQTSEQLTAYANLNSFDTSIIYLNVGGLHMIEGTHNFKVKLMDQIPGNLPVTDYNFSHFDDDRFRARIKRDYMKEFGSDDGIIEATHDIHLNWQHKLIEFFDEKNIEIPPDKVLTANEYRKYRNKFGRTVY